MCDLGSLSSGFPGRIDIACRPLVIGAYAPVQEIKRSDHDSQHVVEVVSNPSRQLTYSLHLLRLAQGLLGECKLRLAGLFRGDIARDRVEQP